MTGDKVHPETGVTVRYFQCNRGGTNRKQGQGIRGERMQGEYLYNSANVDIF